MSRVVDVEQSILRILGTHAALPQDDLVTLIRRGAPSLVLRGFSRALEEALAALEISEQVTRETLLNQERLLLTKHRFVRVTSDRGETWTVFRLASETWTPWLRDLTDHESQVICEAMQASSGSQSKRRRLRSLKRLVEL